MDTHPSKNSSHEPSYGRRIIPCIPLSFHTSFFSPWKGRKTKHFINRNSFRTSNHRSETMAAHSGPSPFLPRPMSTHPSSPWSCATSHHAVSFQQHHRSRLKPASPEILYYFP
ncbi:hypothetical protein BD324DRAFT_152625 [Kockovaella imperatae]|uniref:Uncharacterized protein n=1 Tax=Kockovaella imperatae TaxID=4999 RepID=A0A1Y1U8X1_9TREE|nr:hypothetical protein BD324DRAFT_152625 [Kockovaella imperatae]ORX34473.1 hypothetical protein BD324DRAFT_152625 [Kockovaella imperatae]